MSEATNKEFDNGQIINLLCDDVNSLSWLIHRVPDITKLPFQLVYTLGICYYYFSWTLYATVGIILLMTLGNYGVDKCYEVFDKSKYKWNDKFSNKQNEIITNIKSIKLNSWLPMAEKDMQEGRWIHQVSFYVHHICHFAGHTFWNLIPPLLPIVSYLALSYHGFEISFADTLVASSALW